MEGKAGGMAADAVFENTAFLCLAQIAAVEEFPDTGSQLPHAVHDRMRI